MLDIQYFGMLFELILVKYTVMIEDSDLAKASQAPFVEKS